MDSSAIIIASLGLALPGAVLSILLLKDRWKRRT